jgi:hypothetical protein
LPSETTPVRATESVDVAADTRVEVTAAFRARRVEPCQFNPERRQAMNVFTLGKLADIHIQSLFDGADEGRRARRATSQCTTPRLTHYFHRHT